jgi:hypothetical protein
MVLLQQGNRLPHQIAKAELLLQITALVIVLEAAVDGIQFATESSD